MVRFGLDKLAASRAGNTLLLGGVGFVLIFTLSLLLGMLCARREGTLFDRAVCKLGTITSCIPEFWLSLVLILIFVLILHKWMAVFAAVRYRT